jgi:uncharacterized repeat protein (TIGR02543 family)
MINKKKKKGLTVIEILIVISVIVMLSVLAFLSIKSTKETAEKTRASATMDQIRSEIEIARILAGGEYERAIAEISQEYPEIINDHFETDESSCFDIYLDNKYFCTDSFNSLIEGTCADTGLCESGIEEWKLTVEAVEGGTTNPSGEKYYSNKQKVLVSQSASSGYVFSEWTGDCSGADDCIVTMDSDKTVVANFSEIVEATLTIEKIGEGSTSPSVGVYTHDYGEAVSITATPATNYVFNNWTGDYTGTDPNDCSITMDGDKTVTANFEIEQRDLEVYIDGSGSGSITPDLVGTNSYDYGETVSITATPATGSLFTEWTGACTGTDPNDCSITMDSDKTVTANFETDSMAEWTSLPAGDDTGIKFGTDTRVQSIAYGNGKFVAVGFTGKASYSYDGITWTSLPAGDDTGIKFGTSTISSHASSIVYADNKFVVTGWGGKASYSYDGIKWTSLLPGENTGIKIGYSVARSVTYGNDKFVVVGSSGEASYSSDGIEWTSLTPGIDTGIKFGTSNAYSVTYGNDKFVVVGYAGKASYSSDGIEWTSLTPGTDTGIKFGTSNAYSVRYGNDKFVAVGGDGKASYSSDGIEWTSLTPGTDTGIKFGTSTIASIIHANNKFLATGIAGKASYSYDGITWTSLPAGDDTGIKFDSSDAHSATYGNNKFVVVGNSGKASYNIQTEINDTMEWTSLPAGDDTGIKFGSCISNTSCHAKSAIYGNDKFVVVGYAGKASYSSDGIEWTSLTPGTDTGIKFGIGWAWSVTYGNDKFVVVGFDGKASYSSDGIEWTSLTPGTDTGIKFGSCISMSCVARSVTYGNGMFVAVGGDGKASYSSDGIEWTSLTPGTDTGIKFGIDSPAYSVRYGNDKFVVVGRDGKASYSSDGIEWTSLTPGIDTGIKFGTSNAFSVTYGNDKFVAVGRDGKASYSYDGIEWTSLPAGDDTGIKFGSDTTDNSFAYSVTYGNDRFVVVGDKGKASYSYDGIEWTSLPAGDDTGIKFGTSSNFAHSVTYGNNKFIVVGDYSKASYSMQTE